MTTNSSLVPQFFKDELNILGHVIDVDGIRMDPVKVDTIVN